MQDENYPAVRNLDGIYYRVSREDQSVSRCFTDMTVAEQEEQLGRMDEHTLRRMCMVLAAALRGVGDQLDLIRKDEE